MKRVGIIYSTVDGHTKKICEKLVDMLSQYETSVELFSIENFQESIRDYDLLVIGASIRYGKHNPLITQFIQQHRGELDQITTAFFSVNLVARKEGKNRPETNPYLQKFLKSINWAPDILDVFAGYIDYTLYSFWDRVMIKLIMKITHGPTKTDKPIEYTDWNRVQEFGERLSEVVATEELELV